MIHLDKLTGRLGNRMFQFAYIYTQARKKLIPDVYVQGEEFFKEYADEIKTLYGEGLVELDQVAIHVRRAKNPINPQEPAYSDNPFYVNLTETEYYENAMALFPEEKFIVFSDDIEWCKKQDIFKDCEFSTAKDTLTDMNLMASCKGIIVANSSFSWWAAYISKATKIIAPKQWYTDGVERTTCPDSWIKI